MTDEAMIPKTDRISIAPATEADLPAVLALLSRCGLPPDGLSDHLPTILVARNNGQVVGSAGLELYGDAALLRSVAVAPEYRDRGLGQQLTAAALALARQRHVTRLYLLTETAAEFFPKFGFRPIERAGVPAVVQRSIEFTSACPQSAQAMELSLASES